MTNLTYSEWADTTRTRILQDLQIAGLDDFADVLEGTGAIEDLLPELLTYRGGSTYTHPADGLEYITERN